MFETFDHTADIGLRARAADLDSLFVEAAKAFFSVIVEDCEVWPVEEYSFALEAERLDDLMYDWLGELLYTFTTRHVLFCQFEVRVSGMSLSAVARGEPIDQDRHRINVEVKAITYHELKVEREGDGWLAEVILDL